MHKDLVATTLVLLAAAGVCLAQPPGITGGMIERALYANSNWAMESKGIKQ
jgi:hypothetical protein